METTEHITCSTPIVFLVFNRPETTQRVFDVIRKVRPQQLFVIADGPRHDEDRTLCDDVRRIVQQNDWGVELHTLFRDTNLGCRKSVASGISWAFEHVDRAIILEDDTLPHESFFPYCEALLEQYADNEIVMNISGVNFSGIRPADSYYFSRIPQIWGWATWKRAWQHYDINISSWPEVKKQGLLKNTFGNSPTAAYWEYLFKQLYNGEIKKSAWDAQWVYACMKQQGLSITPSTHLVSNIGFGAAATRTTHTEDALANQSTSPITFPLTHPSSLHVNETADEQTMKNVFRVNNSLNKKIRWFFKSRTPQVYALLQRLKRRS